MVEAMNTAAGKATELSEAVWLMRSWQSEKREAGQKTRKGGGVSVWERSLTEFTLSLSEGFEMTSDYWVVIPSGSEESFSLKTHGN
jgi:hypothetical protein